jgi:hypothetical protein
VLSLLVETLSAAALAASSNTSVAWYAAYSFAFAKRFAGSTHDGGGGGPLSFRVIFKSARFARSSTRGVNVVGSESLDDANG